MSPRFTKALQKPAERIGQKFFTLFDDEEIATRFNTLAYMMLKRLGIQHPIRDFVQEQLGPNRVLCLKGTSTPVSEEELQLQLLDIIEAKRPDFYHVIGTHIPFFRFLILRHLQRTATNEETKGQIGDYLAEIRLQTYKIERFPDNPITVDENPATGKLQYDLEDATPKHAMEILAYRDSLRPAGRVGRPRGSEKPKKSGRATLDPELALRMYQAKLDAPKWSWQQAARGVLGASIPSDLKARERLRQKIARLLALGARLHHKKSVS